MIVLLCFKSERGRELIYVIKCSILWNLEMINNDILSFLYQTCIVKDRMNCLDEAVLMSTHNLCLF